MCIQCSRSVLTSDVMKIPSWPQRLKVVLFYSFIIGCLTREIISVQLQRWQTMKTTVKSIGAKISAISSFNAIMAVSTFKDPNQLNPCQQECPLSTFRGGVGRLRGTHLYSQRRLSLYTPCKNNHMLRWVGPVKQSSLTRSRSRTAHTFCR